MEDNLSLDGDNVFDELRHIDPNISSDALQEDSFSSVLASTPRRSRGSGRGNAPHKTVNRIKCPTCDKTYANERTLNIHTKIHIMEAASKRASTLGDLKEEMSNLMEDSINHMLKSSPSADLHRKINLYCTQLLLIWKEDRGSDVLCSLATLLSTHFYKMLTDKAVFPSAIKISVHSAANKLLTCSDFRQDMKTMLLSIKETEPPVLNIFLGEFMLVLSSKVLVFTMQKISGGAVLSGVAWKGNKFKLNSPVWGLFVEVLNKNFLQNESGEQACCESVRAFTAAQDRGGLTYINAKAFDFFAVLFDLLMCLEGHDGSLPRNVLDEHVLVNDNVICIWYDVIQNDLSDEESLELLIQICQCCVRVVAKGIMKRKLNDHFQKSYSSVPLRSRLAM